MMQPSRRTAAAEVKQNHVQQGNPFDDGCAKQCACRAHRHAAHLIADIRHKHVFRVALLLLTTLGCIAAIIMLAGSGMLAAENSPPTSLQIMPAMPSTVMPPIIDLDLLAIGCILSVMKIPYSIIRQNAL